MAASALKADLEAARRQVGQLQAELAAGAKALAEAKQVLHGPLEPLSPFPHGSLLLDPAGMGRAGAADEG